MERRVAIAGAVVLLLSAVIVVQLLDPQFGEREPPEVDFSEPPNEVAADAAAQFEYVDYAYRVDIKYDESEEWRQWSVTHVDHSNRTYRKVGPGGEQEEVLYGTTAAGFVRHDIGEDWQVIGRTGFVYPVPYLTQPIYVEQLREADASILAENLSTIEIQVNVNPLKIEGDYPGNSTLIINKRTSMIENVHIKYNPNQMGTQYLRLQVTETGTTVKRPEELSFSPSEIFWDLARGPLFRIEWVL